MSMEPMLILLICATLALSSKGRTMTSQSASQGLKLNSHDYSRERFAKSCTPSEQINPEDPITCLVYEESKSSGCPVLPEVDADQAPGQPHALRVYTYTSAHVTQSSNPYQLRVNISWEPPYDASQKYLTGFNLIVHDYESDRQRCFIFFLPNSSRKWESRHIESPPRFRFWTVDVFSWNKKYSLELFSLPKAKPTNNDSVAPYAAYDFPMYKHPEKPLPPGSFNCTERVNPDGEKWLAGFKRVFVNANDREIEAEFISAPPQYCFDAYEVQLADQRHPLVKVETIIVTRDELYSETMTTPEKVSVKLGRVIFKNITVGTSYLITVIARERDANDRCVCMSSEYLHKADPTERNVPCHCLGATWPLTPFPENLKNNSTFTDCYGRNCERHVKDQPVSPSFLLFAVMLGVALFALIAGLCILVMFWNHYRRKGLNPFTRVRFIPGPGKSTTTSTSRFPLFSDDTHDNLAPEGFLKLTYKNVLVVYAHDSAYHDACVESLSQYLQSNCQCRVAIDVWCMHSIANNRIDWVYKSMQEADKVILVHSESAYHRYQSKLIGGEPVHRADHVPGDDLYIMQLDLALRKFHEDQDGYKKFLNVYFPYTSYSMVQRVVAPDVHFEIPRNLNQLVNQIHETSDCHHENYMCEPSGAQLAACIESTIVMHNTQPDWFLKSHVRGVVEISSTATSDRDRLSDSPSVSDSAYASSGPENHSSTHSSCAHLESSTSPVLQAESETKQLISHDSGIGHSGQSLKSDNSVVKRNWRDIQPPSITFQPV